MESETGLADGAPVTVDITPQPLLLEERRRRVDLYCGAWADDDAIPKIFEEILRDRTVISRDVNFDAPS